MLFLFLQGTVRVYKSETKMAGEKGKISKAIEGNQGVYVFTITNIIEPVDNDYTAERERLTTSFLNIGKFRAIDALEGYADIKDYRFKVVH